MLLSDQRGWTINNQRFNTSAECNIEPLKNGSLLIKQVDSKCPSGASDLGAGANDLPSALGMEISRLASSVASSQVSYLCEQPTGEQRETVDFNWHSLNVQPSDATSYNVQNLSQDTSYEFTCAPRTLSARVRQLRLRAQNGL